MLNAFAPLARVADGRVVRHTLYRVARQVARPVRVGGRRYERAARNATGYVAAATHVDMMASTVCAGADVGVRYRCDGHRLESRVVIAAVLSSRHLDRLVA